MSAKHRLKQAIDDLLADAVDLDTALHRHFSPGFVQTVNGQTLDRTAFAQGIAALRREGAQATVTVLDEVALGLQYAQRHRMDVALRDGSRFQREVYVFAELDETGRFARIHEAAVDLGAP